MKLSLIPEAIFVLSFLTAVIAFIIFIWITAIIWAKIALTSAIVFFLSGLVIDFINYENKRNKSQTGR